jgi:plastocyanin
LHWKNYLATGVAVTLLACSGDDGPSDPGTGDGGNVTVTVSNNSFAPATVSVPLNGIVTWNWSSQGVEHNVTFETGPASGNRTSGTFSHTFGTAGSFPYACTIHAAQGMSGVINVSTGSSGDGGGGGGGGGDDGGYP